MSGIENVGALYEALAAQLDGTTHADPSTWLVIDLPDGSTYTVESVTYQEDFVGAMVIRAGRLVPGDSADAAAEADARTGLDRDAVRDGDTITYVSHAGDRELSGRVEYATADAVHVTRDRLTYAIAWSRVTGHQPKADEPEPVRFTRAGTSFDLVAGREYIVRYRIEGQRFDREARLGFAGRHASMAGRVLFDADTGAEGGTQTFETRWILAAEQVECNKAARYIGRRAPEVTR